MYCQTASSWPAVSGGQPPSTPSSQLGIPSSTGPGSTGGCVWHGGGITSWYVGSIGVVGPLPPALHATTSAAIRTSHALGRCISILLLSGGLLLAGHLRHSVGDLLGAAGSHRLGARPLLPCRLGCLASIPQVQHDDGRQRGEDESDDDPAYEAQTAPGALPPPRLLPVSVGFSTRAIVDNTAAAATTHVPPPASQSTRAPRIVSAPAE